MALEVSKVLPQALRQAQVGLGMVSVKDLSALALSGLSLSLSLSSSLSLARVCACVCVCVYVCDAVFTFEFFLSFRGPLLDALLTPLFAATRMSMLALFNKLCVCVFCAATRKNLSLKTLSEREQPQRQPSKSPLSPAATAFPSHVPQAIFGHIVTHTHTRPLTFKHDILAYLHVCQA